MNILASVHLYPPTHLCGAEFMLHAIAKHMTGKWHSVKVLMHQGERTRTASHYIYDDIDVFHAEDYTTRNLFDWADIVVTHLDFANWTHHMAKINRIPCVHLIHNTHPYQFIIDSDVPQYIVYNAEWAAKKLDYKHPSIILPPPCDYRVYNCNPDPAASEYICLINLDHNKGGHILQQIAAALPGRKFIGVMGSYSEPNSIGQYTNQPNNVTVLPKQQDIREVYKKTRILLMPSEYESWGRTATEAMASGIPVICTPTPGLLENCGEAGIYVQDRNKILDWVAEIKKLDDPKKYKAASAKAKKRAVEHDPREGLDRLEIFMAEAIRTRR